MRVVTGDMLNLSYALQRALLMFDQPPEFADLVRAGEVDVCAGTAADRVLAHLQSLPGRHGYVYRAFSDGEGGERRFFTSANAAHIDAIRHTIAEWSIGSLLSEGEEAYLLASLLDAADRVANTAGTYYAHLKSVGRRPNLPLTLRLPATTTEGSSGGCHRADALTVVSATSTDILYLDPPYNERDYSGYYHLPETITIGDTPEPHGRSGAPVRRQPRSAFYRKTQAADALGQICSAARAQHIVVHYTPDGLIPHDAILESLRARGSTSFEDREVRAYSSRSGVAGSSARHRLYWCQVTKQDG